LLLEGEKKTDAAAQALQGCYVAAGLPSGAKAIDKVDLSPLVEHRVAAWPDHDQDGFSAMAKAARVIESSQIKHRGAITESVHIVKPDPAWPSGHDIADLIETGSTARQLVDF